MKAVRFSLKFSEIGSRKNNKFLFIISFQTIFILAVFVVAALARPQNIPIVTQTGVQDESGQYAFSYSTGNGIAAAEHGSLKPNPLRTDNILVKTVSILDIIYELGFFRTEMSNKLR